MDAPAEPTANPLRQLVKRGLERALPPSVFRLRESPASSAVFLTFDDGPHPEHTPRLLDVLREHGARATFFVIGGRALEHPALVRRIVDEGHSLGHHSFFHTEPATTSAAQLARETRRTVAMLAKMTGSPPRLFRPPHGKLTAGKLLRLWRGGQTVVLWNVDPKDFAKSSADEVRAYFEAHPLDAGDIVLLHDTHPHAAGALPWVAAETARRGLALAALPP